MSLFSFRKLGQLSRPKLIALAIVGWLLFTFISWLLAIVMVHNAAVEEGVEMPTLQQLLFGE